MESISTMVMAVCAAVTIVCAALALFVRLIVKSQIADLLEKLNKYFVRKETYEVRSEEVARRLRALELSRDVKGS